MTASHRPGPSDHPAPAGSLDSTAQLMTRITAQLSSQLGHLAPGGLRRRPRPRSLSHPAARRPPTLVAVAHGSRDPEALRTVTALVDRVRALRPDLPVRLGHVELNHPLLADTLAALHGEAVLVPLLLGRGYHIKRDLPDAAAAAPHLSVRVAAPLGPHPLLAEALHARLAEAGWTPGWTPGEAPGGLSAAGVVLAAAGSRDRDSAADTARTAALLSARLGGVPVLPGYASGTGPTVAEAVRALTGRGRGRIAVASYFAAPGRFATQCAAAAPGIAAAPLGDHAAVARLVVHRYEEALASAPMSHPAVTVGV
ncbi:CbiX/SirB N-terminal domain-containing protein [Streptomyces sparsogenes]|uniref:sirohydrochlorin chelatase n=1 Tax=Streptomyces sparsogenes TaxID=67365 RepID=UPI00340A6F8A